MLLASKVKTRRLRFLLSIGAHRHTPLNSALAVSFEEGVKGAKRAYLMSLLTSRLGALTVREGKCQELLSWFSVPCVPEAGNGKGQKGQKREHMP